MITSAILELASSPCRRRERERKAKERKENIDAEMQREMATHSTSQRYEAASKTKEQNHFEHPFADVLMHKLGTELCVPLVICSREEGKVGGNGVDGGGEVRRRRLRQRRATS